MNAERLGVGAFLCLVVLGVAYQMGFGRTETVSTQPDTVYLETSKRSAAVAETTSATVVRFQALRDSLRRALRSRRTDTLRDTTYDTAFVRVDSFLVRIDTVFAQCERCAAQLREHRRVSDSVIKARNDTIFVIRRRLEKCRGSRPWWAVAGLGIGVVSCKLP